MTKITLTEAELFKFMQDNPSIPLEYCTGILLQQKGIKFKPIFGVLTEEHIILRGGFIKILRLIPYMLHKENERKHLLTMNLLKTLIRTRNSENI